MAVPASPTQLKQIYKRKLDFIDNSLDEFNTDLKRLQSELFDTLITEYISQFTIQEGVIIQNEHNLRLLAELDKTMQQFKETFASDTFKKLGENMIKMTDLTSEYFRKMTGATKRIDNIAKKLDKYRAAVGMDKKGNVIKGSFLDKLAETQEIRSKLSRFMTDAVTKEMNYKDFSTGLKDMIKGSTEVNGAMERYVGTYAHDTFFSQARQQDNFFADELGMENFVYEGNIVEASRPFCIKRHGKTFTRAQGEAWNALDWQGKIEGVDFFDQCGGYNCRHTIRWITDVMAEETGIETELTEEV